MSSRTHALNPAAEKRDRNHDRSSSVLLGSPFASAAWAVIVATVALVPMVMDTWGTNNFRLPKDVTFIAAAICIVVLGAYAALFAAWPRDWRQLRGRPLLMLAVAALVWSLLCTLVSTNRNLSARSLLWLASVVVLGFSIALLARGRTTAIMIWPIGAATINAIVFLLQRTHLWNPFQFPADVPPHHRYTALIGNPNDVGSFFVAPALAVAALAISDKPRRLLWLSAAPSLVAALATGPLTSLIAFMAGLIAMAFCRSVRMGFIAVVVIAFSIVGLTLFYTPLRTRVQNIAGQVRSGDYSEALSGRVTPFFAALAMAADHPVTGVGPGCFRWEYFPYKIAVEKRNPKLAAAFSHDFNAGETHNDHLQFLAETGIPGYIIFLSTIVAMALGSFQARDVEDGRQRFSRLALFPLAVALVVLCSAHFPLHLAAPTLMFLFIGAASWTWAQPLRTETSENLLEGSSRRFHGRSKRMVRVAVATVIGTLAALGLYRLCYVPLRCNDVKKGAETSTIATVNDSNSSDSLRAVMTARSNLQRLETCVQHGSDDVELHMLAAANYRLLHRYADAARMYEAALQFDRRPEIYYNLGAVQLEMHQREKALANLLNAVLFSRAYLADLPFDVQSELNATLRRQYPYLLGR